MGQKNRFLTTNSCECCSVFADVHSLLFTVCYSPQFYEMVICQCCIYSLFHCPQHLVVTGKLCETAAVAHLDAALRLQQIKLQKTVLIKLLTTSKGVLHECPANLKQFHFCLSSSHRVGVGAALLETCDATYFHAIIRM